MTTNLEYVAGSLRSSTVHSDTLTVGHCGPVLAMLMGGKLLWREENP